ncbi:hypothetical protein EVG20_g5809 [Dentipellis fragilis]|uniref:RING-type domain-containing protein n=1 Tax=Dentipellis fragilis TaxID=205917 RepID=A0A4Y9YTG8_9AGAM|nr:hypothetical protein EVG20_g5809 [Dentipellis fragilis]
MSGSPSPLSPPQVSSSFFPPALRPPAPKSTGTRSRIRPRVPSRLSLEGITEEPPVLTDSPVDIGSNLSPSSARLRRTPSHKSLLSSPALARVKNQWEHPGPNYGTEPKRHTFTKAPRSSGKKGVRVEKEFKDVCGICFEAAMKPNQTKCCGQLFCFQHLSDWLSAQGTDGRCPTCMVSCSIEADTIPLHSPSPAKSPAPRSNKRRAVTLGSYRLPPTCNEARSPSPEPTSPDESGSSSDSDSSDCDPEWYDVAASHHAASPVSPSAMLSSFGGLLRLFGLVIVVGALAS